MVNRNKDAAVSFLKWHPAVACVRRTRSMSAPDSGITPRIFEGSAETLMAAMEENARENPNKTLDVKRAIAEGDLVAVHSHVRQNPDDPGPAVVHLFRFEEGCIVELWDLGQPVPDESPNQYGMF